MAAKKKLKVKDNPSLVRDSFSKAVLNVDHNGFAMYKASKKALKNKDLIITSLQSEIAEIKKQQNQMLKLLEDLNK